MPLRVGASDRDATWSEQWPMMPLGASDRDATRTSDGDATRSESRVNLCGGGSGRQR